MNKSKKKSKSTNVLEIDPNDQHYKRYFNGIYGDESKLNQSGSSSKRNSLNFQKVKSTSFREDYTNQKLYWRRLQLSRTKLKQTAKTSALFSGFAMVAIVELQFNNDPQNPVPPNLLILFGICTILLVSIHILALMIATCILPSVETIALLENPESVCESPHERLRFFIELAWTFSSVIGVFLFLVEVIILVWVKFWEIGVPLGQPGKTAALVSTIAFLPFILMFFFFAFYFYRDFAQNKYEKSTKQIKELESIIVRLEQNDMTYCQNLSSNMTTWPKGQDTNNNSMTSYNESNNKRNQISKQNQQPFAIPMNDLSNLFAKNLLKNDANSRSNDHLLNETIRKQSISIDRIDRNDYQNEISNDYMNQHLNDCLRNEFKIDEMHRYRLKRDTSAESADGQLFGLQNNLDKASYKSLQNSLRNNSYNVLYNTIHNSPFDTFNSRNDLSSCISNKKMNSNRIKKTSKNLQNKISLQSSKSINLEENRAIDDQQSNDSNKMLKKESFNNLSTLVI